MKKAQRKAEARARKRRAKEAKKARKDTKPEDKPAASDAPAPDPEITQDEPAQSGRGDADRSETHAFGRSSSAARNIAREPVLQTAGDASVAPTSGDIARNTRALDDERAREMLVDAAEFCHDIVGMVRETLRGVSNERLAAAREIINAKPQSGVDGRKLPRRAPDPLVTLERIGLQAASLLKRILAKTNPNVGKRKAA